MGVQPDFRSRENMCGIVALSNGDVAHKLFYGLYSIQHRGQDSCGIASYDDANKRFRLKKKQGLVSGVFSQQALENLYGNSAIGHVRYPTISSDFDADAQPFIIRGEMTMAHNGNLANYMSVVKGMDVKPESTCDSEEIMNLLSQEIKSEAMLLLHRHDQKERARRGEIPRRRSREGGGGS